MRPLYITDPEYEVRVKWDHVEFYRRGSRGRPRRLQSTLPLREISRAVLFPGPRVTFGLIKRFLRRQVPVILVSRRGTLLGEFHPFHYRGAALRWLQMQRMFRPEWALPQARYVVRGKILNQYRTLCKVLHSRRVADREGIRGRMVKLTQLAERAASAPDLNILRGLEGRASAIYFRVFGSLLPQGFDFPRRNRHPPRDPINAMLSLGYTLLLGEAITAIVAQGLDPCIGTLHAAADGRPSLALDLIEPWRAPVCDAMVLRMVGLKMVHPDDFERQENGGVRMKPPLLRKFLQQYEQRIQRKVRIGQRELSFRDFIRLAAFFVVRSLRRDTAIRTWAVDFDLG